ncbi:putative AMP-binding domain protein [Ascodesmis nigricans]|uniref:Putative AMP-binding domain protein n=1 Tax=Ascodesmis nigricans TaxID=341454 RepID=A0A4S2MSN8_9PEZI|nr:putative AMP-binding domain protein [Ascodesmis nigricans]
MSGPQSRLSKIASHLWAPHDAPKPKPHNRAEMTPTYFLPRAAAIEPHAEAIVHTTVNGKILRRSYIEYADRARGLAYYLKAHGYKRVGILCPNTPAFLECLFGIPAAGAVHVGVNYRLKPEDVHYVFTHSEVDLIIVDREYLHLLDGFNPAIRRVVDEDTDATEGELSGEFDDIIRQGLDWDRAYGSGWDGLVTQAPDEDETTALAYTSGTTSRPKGVEYTHRGIYLASIANVIESGLNASKVMMDEEARCRYLTTLPLFHATGWTFPWSVVSVRGTHYCLRKIDYDEIWRLLTIERISHFNAAPTVCTLLCASQNAVELPQPVRVTVAASPPTPMLFQKMISLNLMPVHVYGMTETYGPLTKSYFLPEWHNLPPDELYRKMARQGQGYHTSDLVRVIKTNVEDGQIIDVKRDGTEIGEIVFTGNICCKGYYKDADATAALFEGGVLHSGDLAVWHPDNSIQILDRAKDIIISGGENISSVSLESMLAQHPGILEVGVVAVPDSHYGERPKAYITVTDKALTGADVIKWAKSSPHISGFMVPREVEIVDALPKNATGKMQKNVLREWAKGNRNAN